MNWVRLCCTKLWKSSWCGTVLGSLSSSRKKPSKRAWLAFNGCEMVHTNGDHTRSFSRFVRGRLEIQGSKVSTVHIRTVHLSKNSWVVKPRRLHTCICATMDNFSPETSENSRL